MKIRILCPDGHPVSIDAGRLGSMVLCPHCYAQFLASSTGALSWHARPEKGKARPSRDDDDDDEDEEDDDDEPPRKKAKPTPGQKKTYHKEEETRRAKKPLRKQDEEDDEEDEDE